MQEKTPKIFFQKFGKNDDKKIPESIECTNK